MAGKFDDIGRKIGAALAERQAASVPAVTIALDPKPLADAVKGALHAGSESGRDAIAHATALIAEVLKHRDQVDMRSVEAALASIGEVIASRSDGAQELAGIAAAIKAHADAMAGYGSGLKAVASSIDALAKATARDKVIEYDGEGRVVRVRLV